MIIDGKRSLAHVEKISWVRPIEGEDNIELTGVLGWTCISKIGDFSKGDFCVYIEIDSKVPENEWSEFLRDEEFKIKTIELENSNIISQGIALPIDIFDVEIPQKEHADVTALLGITYSNQDYSKSESNDTSKAELTDPNEIFDSSIGKWLMKSGGGKNIMHHFFGNPEDAGNGFPSRFEILSRINPEDCENIPEILEDKTPFIRAQKCDGLTATYILEKFKSSFGRDKFEFYVWSHDLKITDPHEESLDEIENYFWDIAEEYDIEDKLKSFLKNTEDCKYVCWQGEICGPEIHGNPQKLSENHLFCSYMIDSVNGAYDIRDAKKIWDVYDMESIPIESMTYILPDDFEKFKQTADGYYDKRVCEGQNDCIREGWLYYNTADPSFSFKNISRKYLLKKEE